MCIARQRVSCRTLSLQRNQAVTSPPTVFVGEVGSRVLKNALENSNRPLQLLGFRQMRLEPGHQLRTVSMARRNKSTTYGLDSWRLISF